MSEILAITLDLGREVQTQPIRFKNLFQNPFQTAVNDIVLLSHLFPPKMRLKSINRIKITINRIKSPSRGLKTGLDTSLSNTLTDHRRNIRRDFLPIFLQSVSN